MLSGAQELFWCACATIMNGKMGLFSRPHNRLIISTTFTPKIISNLF